jgi:4-alpha-glucanotransferase
MPHLTRGKDELGALSSLAAALGVRTHYVDGLGRPVDVGPETLVRVCAALGAEVARPADAREAARALEARLASRPVPPVLVAWDGVLQPVKVPGRGTACGQLLVRGHGPVALEASEGELRAERSLPLGYHRLTVEVGGRVETCTVISAPSLAWRRPGTRRRWGLGAHLAALRSARSRSVGDLRDLVALSQWVATHGGDLITVLPLLPTFNRVHPEPSPYSPVSRLFWSELILDLGAGHRSVPPPDRLDVTHADAEVRAALAGQPVPDRAGLDPELCDYARFRGAQARLGRNWRDWPTRARFGRLAPDDVDEEEERFHLVAQTLARRQLAELRYLLERDGLDLGLDLPVGVHPDGYDPWARQGLFATGMSLGAPPDPGFPSGQDWGACPVLPEASRWEGHRYFASSVAHLAALAGVLRIDHVMSLTRLYWIPHGMDLNQGTYVDYPAEELFAVVTLESHRNRCELVGENLGTVPVEVNEALPRHRIWSMFLTEFEAMGTEPGPPGEEQVAFIGTHDTPPLAGWVAGVDIDERVRCGLLDRAEGPAEREARELSTQRLADLVGGSPEDLTDLLERLLTWLGESASPLVIPWLEDLWLEADQVNLPGTRSSERPNWQRPMAYRLDEITSDDDIGGRIRRLSAARGRPRPAP